MLEEVCVGRVGERFAVLFDSDSTIVHTRDSDTFQGNAMLSQGFTDIRRRDGDGQTEVNHKIDDVRKGVVQSDCLIAV